MYDEMSGVRLKADGMHAIRREELIMDKKIILFGAGIIGVEAFTFWDMKIYAVFVIMMSC